jgi:uncharacterized protein (TIGR02646 family)
MIHVSKPAEPIPAPLNGSGKTEFEKAKKLADKKEPVKVDFSAYRDPKVKEALLELFNHKCAYCESNFDHVGPGAVEHFRPKGIDRRKNKAPIKEFQGYYWLAANWNNLLLSCTDCNSERGHATDDEDKKISMGKQDKFPLSDETKRCYHYNDDIKKEAPYVLLINPCEEKQPDFFFEFTIEGEIKVNPGLKDDFDKTRSQTSIDVYALYENGIFSILLVSICLRLKDINLP